MSYRAGPCRLLIVFPFRTKSELTRDEPIGRISDATVPSH